MSTDYKNKMADLWLRASLRNANDENFKDQEKKIAAGFEAVSVNKIMAQVQQLENSVLPNIEKKSGNTSDNYKFWKSVYTSLLWALCLADRNEYMQLQMAKEKLLREFYQDHAEKLERELLKYCTLEDLFLQGGLQVQAEAVAQRVRDLLNKK
jgi:hypothetical protein